MYVRKNHVINLIGWLLIGLFLAYKSVLHTISTHDQGVSVAIREYRIQAQARISILKNSDFNAEGGYRSVYETHIFNEIDRIQNELDPYAFIRKNDALTTYIDEHMNQIEFSSSDMLALHDVSDSMKQESLIFFLMAKHLID